MRRRCSKSFRLKNKTPASATASAGERGRRGKALGFVCFGFLAEDVDASDARLDDGLVVGERGHDVAGARGDDLRARHPG